MVTKEDLERLEPGEPREAQALNYSLQQAHGEVAALRRAWIAQA